MFLSECIACIFLNAGHNTINQTIFTQPTNTTLSLVWWAGSQPASANKLNSIQTLASFQITTLPGNKSHIGFLLDVL
jgi:hypothetical protein